MHTFYLLYIMKSPVSTVMYTFVYTVSLLIIVKT